VLGIPGLSLSGSQAWASDEARAQGRKGEQRTARVLAQLCAPGGPTVLHSLRLPMTGIDADIDHVVVAGHHVWIFDSKVWKPAFYWTLAGRTRRGWRRVPFADRHTSEMAADSLRALFARQQVRAVIHRPFIVVWPSSSRRPINLAMYRPKGAKAVHGEVLDTKLGKVSAGGPADEGIVAALYPLVSTARLAATRTLRRTDRTDVVDEF
jgi:hypothetical protein